MLVLSGKVAFAILIFTSRIDVSAYLSQSVVRVGDSVTLTLNISGGSGDVELPEMDDFQVLGSTSSTQVTIINGRVTRSIQYNYTLVPLRSGNLTIPPIAVKTKNGVVYTKPLTLRVLKGETTGKEKPPVFVKAEISPQVGYVGQVFTYVLKLYSRVPLKNAGISDAKFKGFIPDEIVKNGPVQKTGFEYVDGVRYRVTEVIYPLHPLRSGSFNVEGVNLVVEYSAERKKRGETNPFWDFFEDDFFSNLKRKVLIPPSLKVTVKELPEPPEGAFFTGLIGKFSGEWSISQKEAQTDESLTLSFTVSGRGNFRNFTLPESLTFPGFKAFRDRPKVSVTADPHGLKGEVQVKFVLIPEAPGVRNVLEGLKFLYFDPEKEDYVTFPSPEFKVHVKPGGKETGAVVAFSPAPLKEEVKTRTRDIFDIYTGPETLKPSPFLPPLWAVTVLGVFPPLSTVLALFLRRRKERADRLRFERRKSRAFQNFQRKLRSAQANEEVLNAFLSYVKDKTGAEGGLTAEEAVKLLGRYLDESQAGRLRKVVSSIEEAVYGGGSAGEGVKEELLEILSRVEKKGMRLWSLFFIFMVFFTLSAQAVAKPSFQAQVKKASDAYRRGDYKTALEMYLSLYRNGLRNGYILYNAGNAAYRLGRIGQAVLLYKRARFYIPYNSDLSWNLERARERRKDKIEYPARAKIIKVLLKPFSLPVRASFFLLLAVNVLFWFYFSLFILRKVPRGPLIVFLITYLYSAGCAIYAVKRLYIDRDGVVIKDVVKVYSGTDVKSAVLYEVHQGSEVKVLSERGNWYAVELPDGRKGWVRKSAVGIVQDFGNLKPDL